ncbi:hypothetical protein G5I_09378 [Acromyrmex echinatior]|uniref:Uncharacterized protein n=1 Tax=Acromyrmex echinatior TaxID=103372 RepID=F4WU24_ACREC|nr:hypothetical protein G5I_09378 [Acromyrmex echinatior]
MFLRIDRLLRFGLLFLLWIGSSRQQEEDIPHNEVKNWALKFGVDLWEFGKQVTKMSEIQRKYHEVEANVIKRDGLVLVREMAMEVKNMMDFKMNAVMVPETYLKFKLVGIVSGLCRIVSNRVQSNDKNEANESHTLL